MTDPQPLKNQTLKRSPPCGPIYALMVQVNLENMRLFLIIPLRQDRSTQKVALHQDREQAGS